ncbi:MAG: DMT family transporter [Chitinophagaceae bacterium]|jgi:drug/metabolite transporter (DMT)-like permease|nr:DMT family transporter [Chitinophagaceae bacterium]OQY94325.1 MAG: EamA family transporter [Sphingobacteriales bacterium UTBCD1]
MKKSFIQLHVAVFLAGFTGPFGRLINLNEGLLVWYRLLITVSTMWLLYYFTKRLQPVGWRDILKLSAVGLLSALHWVSFYGSIKNSNVSVALVCFSSVGFFTALFEPVLGKKRINRTELFLGLLTIAGIYIIFHFDPKYKTGIMLGVLCALLLSFSIILLRGFIQRINPETALTYQLSGAFMYLTLLMPVYLHYFPTDYLVPDLSDWIWLLILGWFCSVLAFQLTGYSLKKLSAFTVNLNFNLEPVYGIIIAFILFGENKELGWSFFTGLALIASSLIFHAILLIRQERRLK